MSSSAGARARADFLISASHLLAPAAPSVSASIGLDALDSGLRPPALCAACGLLLMPAWSCQVSHLSKPSGASASAKALPPPPGLAETCKPHTQIANPHSSVNAFRYTCDRCHRTCHFPVTRRPKTPRVHAVDRIRTATLPTLIEDGTASSSKPAAPARTSLPAANSNIATAANEALHLKKRRSKKQGTLQAMLAKSATSSNQSPALNLMDFMKH